LTNGPIETVELRVQLITSQANEALVKFARRCELTDTDALSLLLSIGGMLADMAETGEILCRNGTGMFQLTIMNGNGQVIAG
jgi:hypothetical protein